MDKKKLVIDVDAEFHRKLKITATAQGKSIRDFVIEALRDVMRKAKEEKKGKDFIDHLKADAEEQ
jgi:plasmid stability protein